jgi:hypothetical protein
MNRLYNTRTYLAGSMDKALDNGVGWRKMIKPILQNIGICVLDPTDKPIMKGLEDIESRKNRENLLKEGKYRDFGSQVKLLRIIDLRMTDLVDFLVVYYNKDIPTCGTYEEIFRSNISKKPILICVEGGKNNLPHWMFGVLPHEFIFNNWDELISYLKYVDESEVEPPHFKRWTFFTKYDMLMPSRPYGCQNNGRKYKLEWAEDNV